jgi:hypothetical protein
LPLSQAFPEVSKKSVDDGSYVRGIDEVARSLYGVSIK